MSASTSSLVSILKRHQIIIGVLVLAFALRMWGIWNVTHPDEYNEVFEALRVCSGHLNFERWVKRLYLYILAIQYGIFYLIGFIADVFSSPMDFARQIVRNMEPLFIIGRITSALAGTFTVGLLYVIGNKYFNRRVAIVASLLLTFTVFHVALSQQAKVDATLGLLVLATFYFIFKILSTEISSKWDYAWCGFFMALAIQAKINSLALITPLLFALFSQTKRNLRALLTPFLYFSTLFTIGFILGNPPVLLAPDKYLNSLLGLHQVYTTPFNIIPAKHIGFIAYPLMYSETLGPIVSVLTLLAIFHSILRPNSMRVTILSFLITFYLMMGASRNLVAAYYMIPAVPVLYLLLADFIFEIYDGFIVTKNPSSPTTVIPILFVTTLMSITPIKNIFDHELSLTEKNTRILAKDWIEANIPPGTTILMDSGKAANTFAPPIAANITSIDRTISQAKNNIANGKIIHDMVDGHALLYYQLLKQTVPIISYDITSTLFGLNVKTIEYYTNNEYKYFIISDYIKTRRTSDYFRKRNHAISAFYDSLDTNTQLQRIKTFKPTQTNKGDTIHIYRIKNIAVQIDSTNDQTIRVRDHTKI